MENQPSITCPRCSATSYHPGDIANLYCGRCHWWTSDPHLAPHCPGDETAWWRKNGYLYGRQLGADVWLCVAPMITTLRLMICSETFVHQFWCYPYDDFRPSDVIALAVKFDGHGDPAPGWVKHHPSKRRNPRREVGIEEQL